MTSYFPHVPPSFLLLAGLLACAACAHRQSVSELSPDSVAGPPAASTVSSDEQARHAVTSLDQLLAGRISGVIVSPAPGGGIVVRVGAPKSFYSGEDPLFIVDGAPIAVTNGTLTWLNPHDVESITVLKDPSTTAIYGVRGANGVVIIKTKGSH
jgi:TonB-dependent SusC/RagA subfamily outer membrane receptor